MRNEYSFLKGEKEKYNEESKELEDIIFIYMDCTDGYNSSYNA